MFAPVVVQEHAVLLIVAPAEYPVSVRDAPVVEVPRVGAVLAGQAVLRLRSLSALLNPHAPRPMRAAAAAAIAMLSDEQQKKPAMNAPAEAYSKVLILVFIIAYTFFLTL